MLRTFMDRYLADEVAPEDIDDLVDEWHTGTRTIPLSAYLGMNPDEYALWLIHADALPRIREARRFRQPLTARGS